MSMGTESGNVRLESSPPALSARPRSLRENVQICAKARSRCRSFLYTLAAACRAIASPRAPDEHSSRGLRASTIDSPCTQRIQQLAAVTGTSSFAIASICGCCVPRSIHSTTAQFQTGTSPAPLHHHRCVAPHHRLNSLVSVETPSCL